MAGSPERAVGHYDEAVALWRGVPLDGARGPFVGVEVPRLVELREHVPEERTEVMLALGRHGELVAELSGVVAEHPTRERSHGQFMLALYRCGRRGDALEVYRRLRAGLVDGLHLEPTPELQRLHQQVLTGDPALDYSAPVAPARPARPPQPRQLPRPPAGSSAAVRPWTSSTSCTAGGSGWCSSWAPPGSARRTPESGKL